MPDDYDQFWVGEDGVRHADTALIAPQATLEIDRTGAATATLTYQCLWDNLGAVIAKLRSDPHPDPQLSFMYFDKLSANREEAGYTTITVDYKGFVEPEETGGEPYNSEIWSVDGMVYDAPIGNHPDFTKFTDEGNAEYDESGNFVKYRMEILDNAGPTPEPLKNPLFQVETYRRGGATITRTVTTKFTDEKEVKEVMGKLGYIDEDFDDIKPPWMPSLKVTTGSGGAGADSLVRSVLVTGVSVEELGKEGVRITTTWEVSGPGGHPTDIYEKDKYATTP